MCTARTKVCIKSSSELRDQRNMAFVSAIYSPEYSAMGMGQYPICKLKWDILRTSVTACTIDKNAFSAPFGIFYVRTEI